MRLRPRRLAVLLVVFCVAFVGVWIMFGALLPALIAVALLVGATGEYLFPVQFRISTQGVESRGPLNRAGLAWSATRRLRRSRAGILFSPLRQPSRLDNFRGVLVRFAPDGASGDRASVHTAIRRWAPDLDRDAAGEVSRVPSLHAGAPRVER